MSALSTAHIEITFGIFHFWHHISIQNVSDFGIAYIRGFLDQRSLLQYFLDVVFFKYMFLRYL